MYNFFYSFVIFGTRLLSIFAIFITFALASSSGAMAQSNLTPIGRYCGFVYHKGYQTKSELNLIENADGHISGTMLYNDDGVITYGTVTETDYLSHMRLERTLIWHDKYGSGYALLKFDSNFDEFSGRWGRTIKELKYIWTGQRCEDFTS